MISIGLDSYVIAHAPIKMNIKPVASTQLETKINKLDLLLRFVNQLTLHKNSIPKNVNIIEIGANSLLSKKFLRAGVQFYNSSMSDVDVVCDQNHLPFSAQYDFVISPLSLYFAKSPKTHLNQLISILKPGGQLILTTFGHYSLHEIRILLNENTNFELLEFIHPAQLKAWLPAQGEREIHEEWITLPYKKLFDFFQDLKEFDIEPFLSHRSQLSIYDTKKVLNAFQGNLTFQLITIIYKKPHLMRDE